MNLELIGTFHQNYPEAPDGHLERIRKDEVIKDSSCATYAVTLQFNRIGSLLAIGCNDGKIEIWDFCTRRIVRYIHAHVHPVCSVSWSRNSKRLVSASTDNHITIWDVINCEAEDTFRFPCPVLKVQFHPRDYKTLLVCPLKHAPVLLRTNVYERKIVRNEEETANDMGTVASFDRRGEFIYTGNSKSKVTVYRTTDLSVVNSFRCTASGNISIKSIEFSRRAECFLLNCSDKVIRVYNCGDVTKKNSDPEPTLILKDIVTSNQWRRCCFSGDGEYICAGSMKLHSIYLWERSTGTLTKILHGQKGESLLDVVWHPLRPIIVSLSNSFTKEQVSIWAQTQVQNWSAFAPDFKELDENVEYDERESEFDMDDEDKEVVNNICKEEEVDDVDVVTVEPVTTLFSSDEDEEPEDMIRLLAAMPEMDQDCFPQEVDDKRPSINFEDAIKKRMLADSENSDKGDKESPDKKIKVTHDVDLPEAPKEESHPLSVAARRSNSVTSLNSLTGNSSANNSSTNATSGNAATGGSGSLNSSRNHNSHNQRPKVKK